MTKHLSIALVLGLAACGGGKGGGTTATEPGPEPAAALPLGDTRFPGLDWGDSIDAVKADYPDAAVAGDSIELHTQHGGRDAVVTLTLTGDGTLIMIDVAYPDTFASMGACSEMFAQVRAELDKSLGDSAEDNLAAYWSDESASVTLACNPVDEGEESTLTVSYTLPETEE